MSKVEFKNNDISKFSEVLAEKVKVNRPLDQVTLELNEEDSTVKALYLITEEEDHLALEKIKEITDNFELCLRNSTNLFKVSSFNFSHVEGYSLEIPLDWNPPYSGNEEIGTLTFVLDSTISEEPVDPENP